MFKYQHFATSLQQLEAEATPEMYEQLDFLYSEAGRY
jgi:hypothetical protein